MRRLLRERGFTIVETMIVLAVTGMLFVLIAATMAGRQNKSEFEQSVGDARTQVQQTMREVQSGFFPSTSNFTCTKTGAQLKFQNTPSAQGTNSECIFLGKIVAFNKDSDQFQVYTVAGWRSDDSQEYLYKDFPKVVDANTPTGTVSITENHKLLYGLTPVKVRSSLGTNASSFGFITSLGKLGKDQSGNPKGYASGSQQVDLYSFQTPFNATPTISHTTFVNDLNGALGSPSQQNANGSGGIKICFKSGGTNDFALMTIGADSSNLSVDMQIMQTKDCGI